MPEAVAEELGVARLGDVLAGDRVDLGGHFARRERGRGQQLGFQHHLEDLRNLCGPLAHAERPRHVRVVTLIHRAPVDQQRLARSDLAILRPVVRQTADRASRHDALEPRLAGAAPFHLGFDVGRHVRFGPPHLDRGDHGEQRGLLNLRRLLDEGDLRLILNDSQLRNEIDGIRQPLGTALAEFPSHGDLFGDGQVLGLDSDFRALAAARWERRTEHLPHRVHH